MAISDHMKAVTSFYRSPITILANISQRYLEAVFFLGLLAYSALLVWETRGYGPDARLFPLLVGVPLIAMLVLQIVLLLLPDRLTPSGGGMFNDISDEFTEVEEDRDKPSTEVMIQRETSMMFWLIGVIIAIWLFGFLLAIPIFIFVFKYYYDRDLTQAIILASVIYVLIDIMFLRLLNFVLWGGLLIDGGGI